MDRSRIKGALKDKIGRAKEATGKALGDEKLKRKGQMDQVKGKVQNTVGGVRDALREREREEEHRR